MASYTKYYDFVNQLVRGRHDFSPGGSNDFRTALSNGVPDPTHTVLANISELANANGYIPGSMLTGLNFSISETSGLVTVTASAAFNIVTATGAGITYRYAAVYNYFQTSPNQPLIAYYDNGSSVTISSGTTLYLNFGTLFTMS